MTFIGGLNSVKPGPNCHQAAAVNGALEALSRALSVDLSPSRVNIVAPGVIGDTALWDKVHALTAAFCGPATHLDCYLHDSAWLNCRTCKTIECCTCKSMSASLRVALIVTAEPQSLIKGKHASIACQLLACTGRIKGLFEESYCSSQLLTLTDRPTVYLI